MIWKATIVLASAALVAVAGCKVHVDQNAKGEEKTVQVDTPFGGVHVNTDQTTASDLGLPLYPGAEAVQNDDKHKSADVHMGFGEWQLRVRAVSYSTSDHQDKVTAFYKKALARYGDVIVCQGKVPVGAPAKTSEGLTCDDSKDTKIQMDDGNMKLEQGGTNNSDKLELKAGSKRHQHIVGFDDSKNGKTRFALVALDLPAGTGGGKSD